MNYEKALEAIEERYTGALDALESSEIDDQDTIQAYKNEIIMGQFLEEVVEKKLSHFVISYLEE